jgi:hypothetical protein
LKTKTAAASAAQDGEKFRTCRHAEQVGEIAVYVKPTCPHLNLIKGKLVTSKRCCRSCSRWEAKE